MRIREIKQLARTAWSMRKYLEKPLTLNQATDDIKVRMDSREKNFLSLAKKSIYENQSSPYRKLLLWAGCEYEDLQDCVRRRGLEKTLEKLKDEGVYITLEEFKSRIPISRQGLIIETSEADFNNPLLTGKGVQGTTSGSRSKGTRVMYDWDFLAEEATNELILFETNGLVNAHLAFWLPSPPCISGIHNLLMNIKFKRPDKWFSQLGAEAAEYSRRDSRFLDSILLSCRIFGLSVPRPEFTDIGNATRVAKWMETTKKNKGISVVKTYTSSAIRIIQATVENGIDISGNVIFTGGEPLTQRKARFIESAGVKALPRYVATETGLIGASCGSGNYSDDMHIYLDRLAIIQRPHETAVGGYNVDSFLFTSLLNTAGKILLNTDIGDFGNLTVKSCSCLFGELGMDVHVSKVRSYDKLTCEGMTLLGSELDGIVGEIIEDVGGCPDDYQFWETQDNKGLTKLAIVVNPKIRELNENNFIAEILNRLRDKNLNVTSHLWEQAKTLQLVRAYPKMTKRFKILPIVQNPKHRT